MLIKRNAEIYSKKIKNCWVILGKDKNHIRELNETGGFIWELLERPQSINEIVKKIESRYQVERSQVEKEVRDFIQRFTKEGFLIRLE